MWIDIKGYEGKYQINENGQVKRLKEYNRRANDRMLVTEIMPNGYCRITLSKDNEQKGFLFTDLFMKHLLVIFQT